MRTLAQLRDQAKREAINYLTDRVFFALVADRITEAETHLRQLSVQRADLEKAAVYLGAEVTSFHSEIAALTPNNNQESLQQQLHQTQKSLLALRMKINTLDGHSQSLENQIAQFRAVPTPKPPHGLENLAVS